MKRWALLLIGVVTMQVACAARPVNAGWDDWRHFQTGFISDDGRVIDWSEEGRTVSEGQAYALFFALVANDRTAFEQLLTWTENNLSQGDLARRLPAWLWGLGLDGTHKVLDANPASDADLWIAYCLIEAGRLWRLPEYEAKGRALLRLVREQEVAKLDSGVTLLLPGPEGFRFDDRVRVNPSYLMPAQLARFEHLEPTGPWGDILAQYPLMLSQLSPTGRIPNWSQYHDGRHELDLETGGIGSYDAVRVYLWAGMGPSSNKAVRQGLTQIKAFASMTQEAGRMPEKWSARSSWIEGHGPIGFDAALLPYYAALGEKELLQQARKRIDDSRHQNLYGKPARYYDQVLVLFGKGYDEGWFRFDPAGRLVPRWKK